MPPIDTCPDFAAWQRYVDGATRPDEDAWLMVHRDGCASCRALLADVLDATLKAEAVLQAAMATGRPDRTSLWTTVRRWWTVGLGSAAVLTLVLSLVTGSFGPALAAATETFQLQHLDAVGLTPTAMAQIESVLANGHGSATLRQLVAVSVLDPSSARDVPVSHLSLDTGLPDLWPASLARPALLAHVHPATTVRVTLNVAHINDALTLLGATSLFPASLAGVPFTVTAPETATIQLSQGGRTYALAEAARPSLTLPRGTPVHAVLKALLSLPFLPQTFDETLLSAENWRNTLVLPLPGHPENVQFLGHAAVVEILPRTDFHAASLGVGLGIHARQAARGIALTSRAPAQYQAFVLWLQGKTVVAFGESTATPLTTATFLAQAQSLLTP